MIEFTQGDMFAVEADARVNTVNCVGVMGAGIAEQFKNRYPEMFKDYKKACQAGRVKPGTLHIWDSLFDGCIINFPTKRHWQDNSLLEDVESGLVALRAFLLQSSFATLTVPALGCGHGNLKWPVVSRLIAESLADVPSRILVFSPMDSRSKSWKQPK